MLVSIQILVVAIATLVVVAVDNSLVVAVFVVVVIFSQFVNFSAFFTRLFVSRGGK